MSREGDTSQFDAAMPDRVGRLIRGIRNVPFDRFGSDRDWGFGDVVPHPFRAIYGEEELYGLRVLRGTPRDPVARMPARVTRHYAGVAERSEACRNLIKVTAAETEDLSGNPVVVDQATHSPAAGIARIYPEIVRFHVANTCSAHCRFCNQHAALSHPRREGVVGPGEAAEYVMAERSRAAGGGGGGGGAVLREALLSGGDPMVLPNTLLFEYLGRLAEAGIEAVRIGTKELAFFPHRFDASFFEALDALHRTYPQLEVVFVAHFTHPDEFLVVGEDGGYELEGGRPRWRPEVLAAVDGLLSRGFVSVYNQTPIIRGVNDDSGVLERLQREMCRRRVGNHYLFQCRPITGFRHFSVPVEEGLRLYERSQANLSGRESAARFVMSTRLGKVRVAGFEGGGTAGSRTVRFEVVRGADGIRRGACIRARSNPEALWLSDYRDRVVEDSTGKLREWGEDV